MAASGCNEMRGQCLEAVTSSPAATVDDSQNNAELMPSLMAFHFFTRAKVQARLKMKRPTPQVKSEPNAPTRAKLKFQNAQTMPVKPVTCAANCHFTSRSLKSCVSKVTGTSWYIAPMTMEHMKPSTNRCVMAIRCGV